MTRSDAQPPAMNSGMRPATSPVSWDGFALRARAFGVTLRIENADGEVLWPPDSRSHESNQVPDHLDVVSLHSRHPTVGGASILLSAPAGGTLNADRLRCLGDMLAEAAWGQQRLLLAGREIDTVSQRLADSYEEISLIYQLSGGMKVNRRPVDFFRQACLDATEVMNVAGMGVRLCDDRLNVATEPAARGVLYGQPRLPQETIDALGGVLLAMLAGRSQPLLINRLADHASLLPFAGHLDRLLAAPLQRGDELLGCLFAVDKLKDGPPGTSGAGRDFDSQDSKLLNAIATEAAIYLENAHLFDDVRGLMMGLMHSLVAAVDAKDPYTCGHSERVALLARTLTREAGLGDALAERVYIAGLLHDVGKIGVTDSVLRKAGKLSDGEFEEIRKHPLIGARILADVRQLEDILPGVLHHHERYDGRGYPYGLSGEGIPLMGRLLCLADCFDAMTSNRTYRRGMPLEVALVEIRRCAGTQFDPLLAARFVGIGVPRLTEVIRSQQDPARAPLEAIAYQRAS